VVTWDSFYQDGSSVGVFSRIYHGSGFNAYEDVPIAIEGISVGDIDAGSGSITVTLMADNGSLTVGGDGVFDIEVTGNGTDHVVIAGTIDAINAALGVVDGVVYRSALDFAGSENLTVTVDDGGYTGSGGSLSDTQYIEFFVTGVVDVKGTDGDDVFTGGIDNEQLAGFKGDDILIGGDGEDMFIFADGDGSDVINDFEIGIDTLDLSQISGLSGFEQVLSHATESETGIVFDFGSNTQITLIGIEKSSLLEADFVL